MANIVKMNRRLLGVICAVQAAHKLFLQEALLLDDKVPLRDSVYQDKITPSSDHYGRAKKYYESLDSDAIEQLGLKQNHYCFEAIMRFQVTDEMLGTLNDDLGQFEFAY